MEKFELKKPEYELGPLRAAVTQGRVNIASFQRAIAKEEEKIKEYQGYIKQWEAYNKKMRNGPRV